MSIKQHNDVRRSEAFGTWLGRQIDARLETRAEFAARAGLNRNFLVSIVSGRHGGKLRGLTLCRIANALKLSREEVEEHLDLVE